MTLVLLATNVATLVVLWFVLRPLTQRTDVLRRAMTRFEGEMAVVTPDIAPLLADTDRLITVRILNPLELARNEVSVSAPIGSVAPGLISKIVHDRAVEEMRQELREKGVDAIVEVHAVGRRAA